jgi:HEAT repeat protein
MEKKTTFEDYLRRLRSADRKEVIQAAHELGDQGDAGAVPFLLDLLMTTNDPSIRNAAAVGLRELRDSRAVPYLISLLNDPRTEGNRGTLLYALQELDCSGYLPLLVDLVIGGGWEVSHEALLAIESSKSKISAQDRDFCARKLRAALPQASGYKVELLEELTEMFDSQ